jgi:hypothetical protein
VVGLIGFAADRPVSGSLDRATIYHCGVARMERGRSGKNPARGTIVLDRRTKY